jgi:Fur family ferric uptake transcriptional regulator
MNIDQRIAHLLKHGNLRATNTRKVVLEEFLKAGATALSSYEIERKFDDLDRITLYRTLKTFEESGIIHQAVDVSGKSKYAICSEDCTSHHHEDHHAHFYCKKCERTVCLDQVKIPILNLPKNYQLEDSQLVLTGVCDNCQN